MGLRITHYNGVEDLVDGEPEWSEVLCRLGVDSMKESGAPVSYGQVIPDSDSWLR